MKAELPSATAGPSGSSQADLAVKAIPLMGTLMNLQTAGSIQKNDVLILDILTLGCSFCWDVEGH